MEGFRAWGEIPLSTPHGRSRRHPALEARRSLSEKALDRTCVIFLSFVSLATGELPSATHAHRCLSWRFSFGRAATFLVSGSTLMHLLYLDESGNENDPRDRYFVLAGLSLFERQTFFLMRAVEAIQEKHFPNRPPVAFHASEIRSGRGFWRNVDPATRGEVLRDLTREILQSPERGRSLFAAAVEKDGTLYGEAAVEAATEQVCKRFDTMLTRLYRQHNDPQRGLIIFSEGRFDARAKLWVREFHRRGTNWGAINNLADIPYFAAGKESRLLQVADLVAHAIWILFEKQDSSLASAILPCFESRSGVLHGLAHVGASRGPTCPCPACASRRTPGDLGPWV